MKFNLFKLQKNKKFSYIPRVYKNDTAPLEGYFTDLEGKKAHYSSGSLSQKWSQERNNSRTRANSGFNRTFWIIFAILSLIALYILKF